MVAEKLKKKAYAKINEIIKVKNHQH